MNTWRSALQCGQRTRSVRDGGMVNSPSHALHLKCIIEAMKPLVVILLLAISVQAQSLADAARKERERRANLKPAVVVTGVGQSIPSAGTTAPEPSKELPKPQTPPPPDPVKIWNDQLNQLRTKIKELQDQETSLLLKQNELNNQVYATVIDQTTKDQAQAQLAQVQQQLATTRTDLDTSRKTLDQMQLDGPPKEKK